MVTLAGTQSDFADAIREIIELDYDAVEAYEAAINRLDNSEYKKELHSFKEDHERHIRELSQLLKDRNHKPPTGPSTKQWLTKGKVVLMQIMGDKSILVAMNSNEVDTNSAYEKMINRLDKWPESESILQRAYEDEKRHKEWIEKKLSANI